MLIGWKYYNHALVPTCAPHERPNLYILNDKNIWKISIDGNRPLLARYCTDFDCEEETSYWYVIKTGPFSLDELGKHYKKNVCRALERCEAHIIDSKEYADKMWDVAKAAFARYDNPDNEPSKEEFINEVQNSVYEFWGAFDKETGQMAGWMSCENHGEWTETITSKYHPDLQTHCRPSDVIHYTVINHYLNDLQQRYICSGSRNINHKTNVQEYKIKNWKFRKAYCRLHIVYNPRIKWIVKLLFPFRNLFLMLDGVTIIHQLNSLLKLEQLSRKDI